MAELVLAILTGLAIFGVVFKFYMEAFDRWCADAEGIIKSWFHHSGKIASQSPLPVQPLNPDSRESMERRIHLMAEWNHIPVDQARRIMMWLRQQAPDPDGKKRKQPTQQRRRKKP